MLVHSTTWINLANTMLSERSPSQKTIYIYLSRTDKFIDTESRLVIAHGSGERSAGWRMTANRYGVSFGGGGENVLKLDNTGGCTTL